MKKIKVGITLGDPSGIGPAVAAKALDALAGLADFTVIGDAAVFSKAQGARRRKAQNFKFIDLNNVAQKNFRFGRVSPEYGRASVEYLDKALELIKNREIECLVTCPVSKEAVNLGGLDFAGHTEYLAARTNTKNFAMMLLNRKLKITLATRHIPLSRVPLELTKERVYQAALLTFRSLRQLFSIKAPRIVVCGLNPHASDNGIIGSEEDEVIAPAVEKLRPAVPEIRGPEPADAAIRKAIEKQYDGVIAMYHDQALIALKASDFAGGVNMTLGLPFVRTSPLHGTAFDIAGAKTADPSSLIAAIRLAFRCASNLKKD